MPVPHCASATLCQCHTNVEDLKLTGERTVMRRIVETGLKKPPAPHALAVASNGTLYSVHVRSARALSDFMESASPLIHEIDLNPIMVLPKEQGCVIVDALIAPTQTKEERE